MDKRKQNYSSDTMEKALESVRNGMSIRKSSALYGIPRISLSDKINQKYKEKKKKQNVVLKQFSQKLKKRLLSNGYCIWVALDFQSLAVS